MIRLRISDFGLRIEESSRIFRNPPAAAGNPQSKEGA
jgi:hypothetical protein